jgi:hypothetical protein
MYRLLVPQQRQQQKDIGGAEVQTVPFRKLNSRLKGNFTRLSSLAGLNETQIRLSRAYAASAPHVEALWTCESRAESGQ